MNTNTIQIYVSTIKTLILGRSAKANHVIHNTTTKLRMS